MRQTIKLLIVEDSEEVRERIVALLREDATITITVAGTLSDAVAAMADRPDLVSVDLRLPDGSGLDVITHAKALRRSPLVYVLTGLPEMTKRCIQAGADLVFDKLTDMPAYLAAIKNHADALATSRVQNHLDGEDTT